VEQQERTGVEAVPRRPGFCFLEQLRDRRAVGTHARPQRHDAHVWNRAQADAQLRGGGIVLDCSLKRLQPAQPRRLLLQLGSET
jgi:hypothetical protein